MSTVIISYRLILDILLQCSVKVTVSTITALNKIQKFTIQFDSTFIVINIPLIYGCNRECKVHLLVIIIIIIICVLHALYSTIIPLISHALSQL